MMAKTLNIVKMMMKMMIMIVKILAQERFLLVIFPDSFFLLLFIYLFIYSEVYLSKIGFFSVQFSCSVLSDSVTPWTEACQACLSFSNSQSLLRLTSIESVMPFNHLILCCPLPLLPSLFPNIRVLSNESVLHIRWPKYWSFSFSISPSNE